MVNRYNNNLNKRLNNSHSNSINNLLLSLHLLNYHKFKQFSLKMAKHSARMEIILLKFNNKLVLANILLAILSLTKIILMIQKMILVRKKTVIVVMLMSIYKIIALFQSQAMLREIESFIKDFATMISHSSFKNRYKN